MNQTLKVHDVTPVAAALLYYPPLYHQHQQQQQRMRTCSFSSTGSGSTGSSATPPLSPPRPGAAAFFPPSAKPPSSGPDPPTAGVMGSGGSPTGNAPPSPPPPPPSQKRPTGTAKQQQQQQPARGNIFEHRADLAAFRSIRRAAQNAYHIRLDDDGPHGNDDVRRMLMRRLSAAGVRRFACVACRRSMPVFDEFPLVDGTFFLSPRHYGMYTHPDHFCTTEKVFRPLPFVFPVHSFIIGCSLLQSAGTLTITLTLSLTLTVTPILTLP